jgi:hypothetical protein
MWIYSAKLLKMTIGIDSKLNHVSGRLVRLITEVLEHENIPKEALSLLLSYITEMHDTYEKEKERIETKITDVVPKLLGYLQNKDSSYHHRIENREKSVIHVWETDNPNTIIYKAEGRAKSSITNSLLRNFQKGRDVLDTGGITFFIRDPDSENEKNHLLSLYSLVELFKENPITKPFRIRKKYILDEYEARGIHQAVECPYTGEAYPNILESNSPKMGKKMLEDLIKRCDVDEIKIAGYEKAFVYTFQDKDFIFALKDNIIIDYGGKSYDLFSHETDTIMLSEVIPPKVIQKYEERQYNLEQEINNLSLENYWYLDSIVHSSRGFRRDILLPYVPEKKPSVRIYCYEDHTEARRHVSHVSRGYSAKEKHKQREIYHSRNDPHMHVILSGPYVIETYTLNGTCLEDINILKDRINPLIPYSIGVIELRLSEKDFQHKMRVINTYNNTGFLQRHPLLTEVKGLEEYEVIDRIKNPKRLKVPGSTDTYQDIQLRTIVDDIIIEFQFKTEAMHASNESGEFSHSLYKKQQDETICDQNWFCDALKAALDDGNILPLEQALQLYYPLRSELLQTYNDLSEGKDVPLEDSITLLEEYIKALDASVLDKKIYHHDLSILNNIPQRLIYMGTSTEKDKDKYFSSALYVQQLLERYEFPVKPKSLIYSFLYGTYLSDIDRMLPTFTRINDIHIYLENKIDLVVESILKYPYPEQKEDNPYRVLEKIINKYEQNIHKMIHKYSLAELHESTYESDVTSLGKKMDMLCRQFNLNSISSKEIWNAVPELYLKKLISTASELINKKGDCSDIQYNAGMLIGMSLLQDAQKLSEIYPEFAEKIWEAQDSLLRFDIKTGFYVPKHMSYDSILFLRSNNLETQLESLSLEIIGEKEYARKVLNIVDTYFLDR